MAYVKIGSSKNAAACLTYGEYKNGNRRKNIVVHALNCYPDSAKEEFQLTRNLWNKDDGIQTHTIIQSFSDDDNITMEEVNNIGLETAKKLFPAHQVVVYTHCDGKGQKKHNHIMISAVNLENGLKINNHGLLEKARAVSDEICKAHNLSIIPFDTPTKAETALKIKGVKPWKEKLKEILNHAKNECKNLSEFITYLKAQNITINERKSNKEAGGKAWTYIINRSDWGLKTQNIKIRGRRLGNDYTYDSIANALKEKSNNITKDAVVKPQHQHNQELADLLHYYARFNSKDKIYDKAYLINNIEVIKKIANKEFDEAFKIFENFSKNNDALTFMRMVVNCHGTDGNILKSAIETVTEQFCESPVFTAKLLNSTLNSAEYNKAFENPNKKGIWSKITNALTGKEDIGASLVMYTKHTYLDDWNLLSEAEKADRLAHQAMDRY